jgi:hypothetical protein
MWLAYIKEPLIICIDGKFEEEFVEEEIIGSIFIWL